MKNDSDGPERRSFKRHVFSTQDDALGFFESPDAANGLKSYRIADISSGGLRFFMDRKAEHLIGVGDTLVLKKIMGKLKVPFTTNIELKVKWVIDHDVFRHIAIGCQFMKISEADRISVDRFVQYEAMGQSLEA